MVAVNHSQLAICKLSLKNYVTRIIRMQKIKLINILLRIHILYIYIGDSKSITIFMISLWMTYVIHKEIMNIVKLNKNGCVTFQVRRPKGNNSVSWVMETVLFPKFLLESYDVLQGALWVWDMSTFSRWIEDFNL